MTMVTEKQLAANRRNARMGGVKTAAGKGRVRLNALKHGLTAREIVLQHENTEAFEELRDGLQDELKPQGVLEGSLVGLIVADLWRLRRSIDMETRYLSLRVGVQEEVASEKMKRKGTVPPQTATEYYTRAIAQEMNDRTGLANLDRYRSSIQRHLSGLLRELKWLQDARAIEVDQVASATDYNRDTADAPALLETGDSAVG
ncbi:hypothetical protein ACFLVJ_01380 [Chloroflexota bacterium]